MDAKFKGLRIVSDEKTQTVLCHKKFPNDDPYKGKAHIDFQGIQDTGDIGRKNDFRKHLTFGAAKDADQLDLFFIHLQKSV